MHIHSRIGRAKPAPHRLARGGSRVVVQSIGNCGVGMVRSLCRVVPLPEPDIAALLFQAPSALLIGLDRCTADLIVGSLRETGLDCAVLEEGAALEEGIGDHEVALNIHDFTRMLAIVLEVMCVLGVDERTARKLVCNVPAVLLGGVSCATVKALRSRFAPLGARIDASRPETARFDLVLGHCPGLLRERAIARLQSVADAAGQREAATGVLSDIDHDVAERAWQELRQLSVPLHVINRDFARYALMLQQGEDTPQLRRCLVKLAGLPEGLIPPMLRNLPMLLQHGLRHDETQAALSALAAVGALGVAEPITCQRFSLQLDPIRDPAPLLPILRELGDIMEPDALDICAAIRLAYPGRSRPRTPVGWPTS